MASMMPAVNLDAWDVMAVETCKTLVTTWKESQTISLNTLLEYGSEEAILSLVRDDEEAREQAAGWTRRPSGTGAGSVPPTDQGGQQAVVEALQAMRGGAASLKALKKHLKKRNKDFAKRCVLAPTCLPAMCCGVKLMTACCVRWCRLDIVMLRSMPRIAMDGVDTGPASKVTVRLRPAEAVVSRVEDDAGVRHRHMDGEPEDADDAASRREFESKLRLLEEWLSSTFPRTEQSLRRDLPLIVDVRTSGALFARSPRCEL
jgi:hypothetical protein